MHRPSEMPPTAALYVPGRHGVGAAEASEHQEPAGHGVGALVPVLLLQTKPAGQAVQEELDVPPPAPVKVPGGQGVGVVDPAAQYAPLGQLVQEVLALAPMAPLKVPAAQGAAEEEPTGQKLPGGHTRQEALEDAPKVGPKVPDGQGRGAVPLQMLPLGHCAQLVEPMEAAQVPRAHALQLAVLSPVGEDVPTGHKKGHTDGVVGPAHTVSLLSIGTGVVAL